MDSHWQQPLYAPRGNGEAERFPARMGGRRFQRQKGPKKVSSTQGQIPLGNVARRGLTAADFGVYLRKFPAVGPDPAPE